MNKTLRVDLALALIVGGTPDSQADTATQGMARQLAGRWELSRPGSVPSPQGVLLLRESGGRLSGTFRSLTGRTAPLRSVRFNSERFSFRLTLPTSLRSARIVWGSFTPTLDADAWTGRLTGALGNIPADLARQRPKDQRTP